MQATPAVAPPIKLAKPDGLNVAFWIVVALSALLAFNALGMLAGAAAADKMQGLFTLHVRPGQTAELDHFVEAQKKMMAAAMPPFAGPVGAVALVLAVGAFVCAWRLNKGRPGALAWFSRVTLAMAGLELVLMLQGLEVQRRIQPLMLEMMKAMPRGPHPEQTAPMMNIMDKTMSGAATMGIVFAVLFALLKVFGALFARYSAFKPAVLAWLGETRP